MLAVRDGSDVRHLSLPERGGKGSEHFPRQKSGREIPHLPPSMDSDICRGKYNEPSLRQEVELADKRRSI